MGFRFQRRLRLFKGVSLNIGKRGVSSISFGTRGAHTTIGKSGIRNTIGLPGTGLSYTSLWPWRRRATQGSSQTAAPSRTGPLNSLRGVVARMLGALTIYAVICALVYVGWQTLTRSTTPSSSASVPAPTPANVDDNSNLQQPDAQVPHHKTHRQRKDASDEVPATTGALLPDEQALPAVSSVTPKAENVPRPISSSTPASTDDLAKVRGLDVNAAEHISAYCAAVAAKAIDRRDAIESTCRHQEATAWHRITAGNEFSSATPAIIQKCSEPPFPDSYVAKEACEKYELNK
jgi:hypothetical protein